MTVEINRLTEMISHKARECEDYKRDCERLSTELGDREESVKRSKQHDRMKEEEKIQELS